MKKIIIIFAIVAILVLGIGGSYLMSYFFSGTNYASIFSSIINTKPSILVLKSSFFKNDPIAVSIAKGNDYLLSDSFEHINSFEFKLLSAFKQLGFVGLGYSAYDGQSPVSGAVNYFRKIHSIRASNYLDKKTLEFLDKELAQREINDKKVATTYPPFSKFMDSPINEPPKEHLAMLLAGLFGSLPKNITSFEGCHNVWTVEEFRDSLSYGLGGNLGRFISEDSTRYLTPQEYNDLISNNQTDFKYCNDLYYSANQLDNCLTPALHVNTQIMSDFDYIYTVTHEFGHSVAFNSDNLTDVSKPSGICLFGGISFVMDSSCPAGHVSISDKKRVDNNGEFISEYAKTNQDEDFAESFSAYVLAGDVFRERAKSNSYLKQKYDFLKNNVFDKREFDTGGLERYELWNSKHNSLPNVVRDYFTQESSWVWDYKYNILKQSKWFF